MGTFSFKLTDEKIQKIKDTFKEDIKPNSNQYIDTFIQRDDLTISIYTSKKVVFQGNDAFFYASSYIDTKKQRQGGSDEVGTGDYFGPVVVCAAIVEESDYPLLEKLGITDSKQMLDTKILEIGDQLINTFKHSILILDNQKYNEVHKTNNLNEIKAKMHNQAYINMKAKGYDIPKACYVDEFVKESSYFEYLKNEKEIYHDLYFETKAESKYPAVAVASVIARYTFLKYMANLESHYGLSLHKGAGDEVNIDGMRFIEKYGQKELNKVAKLHFKNTEYILNNI